MTRDLNAFRQRIVQMNKTFELPTNGIPCDQGEKRLIDFHRVLSEEVNELQDIGVSDEGVDLVALADVLGDIVVYVASESVRWGIPLTDVLHAIMDSQGSKLVNGRPLMAEDGSKFIKGPDYVPPEPKIKRILDTLTEWYKEQA
jgi:hypothetical protein